MQFIKTGKEYELDILANPYGSPDDLDSDGEYFAPDTQFYEDKLELPPAVYYHGGDEKGEEAPEPQFVGRTIKRWVDQLGVWYRVVLDKTSEYAAKVWEAAKEGKARVSSGAVPATVRKEGPKITHWMNGEVSIFDTNYGKQPANKYAIAMPAKAKAIYEKAGIQLPEELQQANAQAGDAKADGNEDPQAVIENKEENKNKEEKKMSELTREEILAILEERDAKKAKEAEAKNALEEQLAKAKKEGAEEAKKELMESLKSANRPVNFEGVNVIVKEEGADKYDNMEIADHALMVGFLGKEASPKAIKALARKLEGEEGKVAPEAQKMLNKHIKAAGVQKSDELNYSTQSSYGDEWVAAGYSNQLWNSIRQDAKVLGHIQQVEIPQGYESLKFMVESTDPTWYTVAQTTDNNGTTGFPDASVTASKLGTADQDLSVKKIGARVVYSGEMNEDSLIPFMSQLRVQLQQSGSEALEVAIIDGDTETGASTNINDIAGTPAGTELFMAMNGLRKLALVTNTANSRSAAGGHGADDYLETVKLMGAAGMNALDQDKVRFLIDPNTHWAALEIDEIKTRDVFGPATIENGRLSSIWGYKVDVTGFMHKGSTVRKANSAGKIDLDTTTNNAYGAILAWRPDQWKFGFKRRMSLESVRIARSDAYEMVAFMRCGLVYRDTEASAISYYVGV